MKNNLTLTILLAFTITANSQITIGKTNQASTNKTSVLLEFQKNTNKGIILPYVRRLPANPTEGTLILDATDEITARVKYYNGSWVDLSGQDAVITNHLIHQPAINQVTETNQSKTIIGAKTTTADGVLVLESTRRCMVLPIVADVQNIPNPSPGMIVYVNKQDAKRLAVFNGSKWSFWKP